MPDSWRRCHSNLEVKKGGKGWEWDVSIRELFYHKRARTLRSIRHPPSLSLLDIRSSLTVNSLILSRLQLMARRTRRHASKNTVVHTQGLANNDLVAFQGSTDINMHCTNDDQDQNVAPIQGNTGASSYTMSDVSNHHQCATNAPFPPMKLDPPGRPDNRPTLPHLQRRRGAMLVR